MDDLDLSGKKVAVFGLGDQEAYPDTFVDGLGILANKVKCEPTAVLDALLWRW